MAFPVTVKESLQAGETNQGGPLSGLSGQPPYGVRDTCGCASVFALAVLAATVKVHSKKIGFSRSRG